MTEDELAEIRGRLEEATPGEWRVDRFDMNHTGEEGKFTIDAGKDPDDPTVLFFVVGDGTELDDGGFQKFDDAKLCAHAPTDLRRLLEEVARLKRLVEYAYTEGFDDGDRERGRWVERGYAGERPNAEENWAASDSMRELNPQPSTLPPGP